VPGCTVGVGAVNDRVCYTALSPCIHPPVILIPPHATRPLSHHTHHHHQAATGNKDIHLHVVDLSSLQQIQRFATAFAQSGKPLHVLINNAATMQDSRSVTAEGVETAQVGEGGGGGGGLGGGIGQGREGQ
jgi:hypothetical protein